MDQIHQDILNALPEIILSFLVVMAAAAVAIIRIWGQVQVSRGETAKVKETLEQEKLKTAENKEKLSQAELNLRTQEVNHKTELEALKLSGERTAMQNKSALEQLGVDFTRRIQEQHQQLLDDMHKQTVAFTEQIGTLKGENTQLSRVVDALQTRLENYNDQKYEAIAQANQIQAELEAVHASEAASAAALTKANELIQNYELKMARDEKTIHELSQEVNKQKFQIAGLEAKVAEFQRQSDDRHAAANAVTARNMRYAVYLMQYKIVLQAIVAAIPLRDMPPQVIKEFSGHSIDVPHLLTLHFDSEEQAGLPLPSTPDPLTLPDIKATKEVPAVVIPEVPVTKPDSPA